MFLNVHEIFYFRWLISDIDTVKTWQPDMASEEDAGLVEQNVLEGLFDYY